MKNMTEFDRFNRVEQLRSSGINEDFIAELVGGVSGKLSHDANSNRSIVERSTIKPLVSFGDDVVAIEPEYSPIRSAAFENPMRKAKDSSGNDVMVNTEEKQKVRWEDRITFSDSYSGLMGLDPQIRRNIIEKMFPEKELAESVLGSFDRGESADEAKKKILMYNTETYEPASWYQPSDGAEGVLQDVKDYRVEAEKIVKGESDNYFGQEYVEMGHAMSTLGVMMEFFNADKTTPDGIRKVKEFFSATEEYHKLSGAEQLIVDGVLMGEDLPLALAGGGLMAAVCGKGLEAYQKARGKIKAVVAAGLVGGCGGAGGFAAIEFNRTLFTELLGRGIITDITGFQALAAAVKAGGKGGLTGFAAGITGGSIRHLLKAKGIKFASIIAAVPEAGMMAEVSTLLQRQEGDSWIPTAKDFFKAAILMAGFNIGMEAGGQIKGRASRALKYRKKKLHKNLVEVYNRYGIPPSQVVKDMADHPQLFAKLQEQLRSDDFIVPEMYVKPLAEMLAKLAASKKRNLDNGDSVSTTMLVPNTKMFKEQGNTVYEVAVKAKDGEIGHVVTEIVGEGEVKIISIDGDVSGANLRLAAEELSSTGRRVVSEDVKFNELADKANEIESKRPESRRHVEDAFTTLIRKNRLLEEEVAATGIELTPEMINKIRTIDMKNIDALLESYVGKDLAQEIKVSIELKLADEGHEVPITRHGIEDYVGYVGYTTDPPSVIPSQDNVLLVSTAKGFEGSVNQFQITSRNPLILPKPARADIEYVHNDPAAMVEVLTKAGVIRKTDITTIENEKGKLTIEDVYDLISDGVALSDGNVVIGKGHDSILWRDDGLSGPRKDMISVFKEETSSIIGWGKKVGETITFSEKNSVPNIPNIQLHKFGSMNDISGHAAYQIYKAITDGKAPRLSSKMKDTLSGFFKPKIKANKDGEPVAVTGDVVINRKLFDNESNAVRVVMHEVGHWLHLVGDIPYKTRRETPVLGILKDLYNASIDWAAMPKNRIVTNELKALTQKWSPFDPAANPNYTKYRFKDTELFADFFSAFILNPKVVQSQAPHAYGVFLDSVSGRKFSDAFDKLSRLEQETTVNNSPIMKSMGKGYDEVSKARSEAIEKETFKSKIGDSVSLAYRDLIDRQAALYQIIKRLGKNEPKGKAVRDAMEEELYATGPLKHYITRVFKLLDVVEGSKIPVNVITAYMELSRRFHDKGGIAQSELISVSEAATELARLNATYPQLNKFRENFHALRKEYILPELREMYSSKFFDDLVANEFYTKNTPISIAKFLAENGGGEAWAGAASVDPIKLRQGFIEGKANVLYETMKLDVQLVRFALNNTVKSRSAEAMKKLQEMHPEEIIISKAKSKKVGDKVIFEKPLGDQRLIEYRENGEAKGVYVSKWVADALTNPARVDRFGIPALLMVNRYFRNVYTVYNPGFWGFNLFRDYQSTIQNLPAKGSAKYIPYLQHIQYLPFWLKGGKQALDLAYEKDTVKANEFIKRKLLVDQKNIAETGADMGELGRMAEEFRRDRVHVGKLSTILDKYAALGQTLELQNKVAGKDYLEHFFPEMSRKDVNHLVRTRAGSPAYLRKGALSREVGAFSLFYNAIKEGYRGEVEAYSDDPMQFTYKIVQGAVLPAIIQIQMMEGNSFFSPDTKAIMAGVSPWDMMYYHIYPIRIDENGKSVYIRLPLSPFQAQIHAAIIRNYTDSDSSIVKEFTTSLGEQFPSLSPLMKGIALHSGEAAPLDPMTRREIMSSAMWKGDSKQKDVIMHNYYWGMGGGGIIGKEPFGNYDVDKKSGLEEFLKLPLVSNTVGRFLRVSGAGHTSKAYELRKPIDEQRAKDSATRKEIAMNAAYGIKPTAEEQKFIDSNRGPYNRTLNNLKAERQGIFFEVFHKAGKTNREVAKQQILGEARAGNEEARRTIRTLEADGRW